MKSSMRKTLRNRSRFYGLTGNGGSVAIQVNSCLVKKQNNAVIVTGVYINGCIPSETLVKWVN